MISKNKPRREELEGLLKDVYAIRSRFSHVGESPPTEVVDLFETAPVKIEFMGKEQRLRFVRAPTSFFWFERIVHDSILNFVLNML